VFGVLAALYIDQPRIAFDPPSQVEASILAIVTDDRAVTESRNIRHS
jgi:hypothetical protein